MMDVKYGKKLKRMKEELINSDFLNWLNEFKPLIHQIVIQHLQKYEEVRGLSCGEYTTPRSVDMCIWCGGRTCSHNRFALALCDGKDKECISYETIRDKCFSPTKDYNF